MRTYKINASLTSRWMRVYINPEDSLSKMTTENIDMAKVISFEREIVKADNIRLPYDNALKGDFHGLIRFYQNKLDALFNPITSSEDTVCHIAAQKGNKATLEALLRLVPMPWRIELLKMKNIQGNTILHEVATTENVEAASYLITELLSSDGPTVDIKEIQKQLLGDRNNLGETPLFRAAEFGKTKMLEYFLQQVQEIGDPHDHYYTRKDGMTIIHSAVISHHFGTAIWLLNKDERLATWEDKNGKTILHLLALMPTAFKSTSHTNRLKAFIYECFPNYSEEGPEERQINNLGRPKKKNPLQALCDKYVDSKMNRTICECLAKGWVTLAKIWESKNRHFLADKLVNMLVRDDSWLMSHTQHQELDNLICLERDEEKKEDTDKGTTETGGERSKSPDTPLLIAAGTGIMEIVTSILDLYPQAVERVNQKGQNILHVSILHRQLEIYKHVMKKKEVQKRLVLGIDNDGSTILHHAANIEYYHGGSKPTPALKLQDELTWFKDVQDLIPHPYSLHRNKGNQTAKQLFDKQHEEQLKLAQEWVKTTCQSSSTVAILVATVVFAAAYTAPGGFHANSGRPILLTTEKPLFSFFTVMDIAGLASSLTSVVVFLSILTSSLEMQEFARTIPRNMSIGFTSLFFSVTATMLTFTATIFLLVQLDKKLTTSLTYAAALLPICVFALFQFPLYFLFFKAAIKSIFDFIKKILPGV